MESHSWRHLERTDCFGCAASQRRCDRKRHRCGTCQDRQEICAGYPRDLQWQSGIASRGKMKGKTFVSSSLASAEGLNTRVFRFKEGRPRQRRKHSEGKQAMPSIASDVEEREQQVLTDRSPSHCSPPSSADASICSSLGSGEDSQLAELSGGHNIDFTWTDLLPLNVDDPWLPMEDLPFGAVPPRLSTPSRIFAVNTEELLDRCMTMQK